MDLKLCRTLSSPLDHLSISPCDMMWEASPSTFSHLILSLDDSTADIFASTEQAPDA